MSIHSPEENAFVSGELHAFVDFFIVLSLFVDNDFVSHLEPGRKMEQASDAHFE